MHQTCGLPRSLPGDILRPGCPLGKAHQAAGSQEEGGNDACCKFCSVVPGVLSAGSLCPGCPLGSFLQVLYLIFIPLWLRALFLFNHALLHDCIIMPKPIQASVSNEGSGQAK